MAQKERLAQIRHTIKQDKKVSVAELSNEYAVTEETIRRDLEKLENEGLITRTFGGAVLNMDKITENIDYLRRAQTNLEAKVIIGQLVTEEISTHMTIGADASSTVMEAIAFLQDRSDVTVLTNSVKIIRELDQGSINIISTGGIVNRKTFSMQGNFVRRVLNDYYVEVVLISCKALEIDGGVFDSNDEEAELKKALISRGQKVILLVDHTKFNKVAFVKVLDLDQLDMVITDQEPEEDWKKIFKEKNIKLKYPGC